MTKEQFRQIAKLLAKVKAEVENIMDGELKDYSIYSHNDTMSFGFGFDEGEKYMLTWIENGADVENGKIIETESSMWINREEEF